MIKLGPGVFILLPALPGDIHSLLNAYLFQFPPFFFSFNFPEVSPFVVNSSPVSPRPRPPTRPLQHTQVSFSFVSKPRQKCWVWEVFIGCHLDKSKNLNTLHNCWLKLNTTLPWILVAWPLLQCLRACLVQQCANHRRCHALYSQSVDLSTGISPVALAEKEARSQEETESPVPSAVLQAEAVP